ncbi:MAG: 30S ribosomal protein S1, partial [Bacteroidales bacterium]|nr:30S ribosomal protein S1 [Bacteroidales bacterium]
IALPYGVEGFATPRHLIKQDGTQAKVDEKLSFKVIEFNKSQKRIIVSHSRTFEEAKADDKERKPRATRKASAAAPANAAVRKQVEAKEVTTLGDITNLAALKGQLEAAEKKND